MPLQVSLRMVAKRQQLTLLIALATLLLIVFVYIPKHVDGYSPPNCSLSASLKGCNTGPNKCHTLLQFGARSSALTSCTISGVGVVSCNTSGTVTMYPSSNTSYTFTASDGTQPCSVTIPMDVVAIPSNANLAGSQTYSTPGTYTFTVPTYSQLTVQLWGGGGGGGGGGFVPSYGGGGGGYSYATYGANTLPSTVTVTVGSGGSGGGSNAYLRMLWLWRGICCERRNSKYIRFIF